MGAGEVVVCNPVRTAIGTYGGSLKDLPATCLGAAVIRDTLRHSALNAWEVQAVLMGNVTPAECKMNPARRAAINADVPVVVPALSVNRVCSSGAQGIGSAAQEIWSDMIDRAIAGGMENMDRAPYLLPQARWGARMGEVTRFDSMLHDSLNVCIGSGQGVALALECCSSLETDASERIKESPLYIQLMGETASLPIMRIVREARNDESASRDYDFSQAAVQRNLHDGYTLTKRMLSTVSRKERA